MLFVCLLVCYTETRKGEKMKETLHEKLDALAHTKEYAFHMPGHKRNPLNGVFGEAMKIDITEIEGFDNLHHPEGILKKEQEFASFLYGVKQTFFLVNGSTCGVLASICAMTKDGDAIIMARNSHRSAYNAVFLKGLRTYYVYPSSFSKKTDISGKIEAKDIAKQMDENNVKVVFITSPTYEGIVSDIEDIAREVHKRDGILIVDEAHGAHFGFHADFPKSAITRGADIVIQSMHKTLPSLTQTALLHICSDRVSTAKIAAQLSVFQTSSPSYVLMSSMSRCLHFLQEEGKEYFDSYLKKLNNFYKKTACLKHLSIITADEIRKIYDAEFDPSKINICAKNLVDVNGMAYAGKELAKDLLEKYQLQMEMVSENYVLAMTSICDTQEGFDRLEQALFDIDRTLIRKETDKGYISKKPEFRIISPQSLMTLKAAQEAEKEKIDRKDWEGKISAEYIYLYPPGSPILTPGEVISKEICELIQRYIDLGLNIQGPEDYALKTLWIVKN